MEIRRITSRILLGVLSLILLHIVSPSARVMAATDYYHHKESFSVSPGASVVVEVAFHEVEVTIGADARVDVEVNTQITATSEQNVARLLREYEPVFTENEQRLQIRSRSDGHSVSTWNCSGQIKIAVPAKTSLEIKSASGAIRINGPVKKTELHSISGTIDMMEPGEEINVSTVSGNINGYWETIPEQIILAAKSVSGSLHFRFPKLTMVSGELKTTSGRIDSEFPGRFTGRSHRLFILEGGYDVQIDASTVGGSIQLGSEGRPFSTQMETFETEKPVWSDVSFDLYGKEPSPVLTLNLYYVDRKLMPGLKYRLKEDLYATGNIDYSYQEWALRMQLGAIYYLPHDFFLLSFYGGGGVQFSAQNGYQYPYVVLGSDFLFFFGEIIYPWEINYSPSTRCGFSFNF